MKDGGTLLSVHVDDNEWSEKAEHILQAHDADDISKTTEVGPPILKNEPKGRDMAP
ncbi:hypothetical protein D3C86_2195250 [compost metagenome]